MQILVSLLGVWGGNSLYLPIQVSLRAVHKIPWCLFYRGLLWGSVQAWATPRGLIIKGWAFSSLLYGSAPWDFWPQEKKIYSLLVRACRPAAGSSDVSWNAERKNGSTHILHPIAIPGILKSSSVLSIVSFNRPFARWRLFITTTKILFLSFFFLVQIRATLN